MLRLGVVSNEYFDRDLGRMGGFGFAARQVIRLFADDPSLGVEIVCLPGDSQRFPPGQPPRIHGATAAPWEGYGPRAMRRTRRKLGDAVPDLLLTIDYRRSFRTILLALPRTPAIVWVRDPRTPADVARVSSLRLPDRPEARPFGIDPVDCRSLRWVDRAARAVGRPLHYATVSMHLAEKIPETYAVQPRLVHLLPNIVTPPRAQFPKAERPTVLFLGRLDPIKRPWLFFELAARFPEVEFRVLGQTHGSGPSAWVPTAVPPNVRQLGHLEGEAKEEALAAAWLLVNTSVHEAVAFSFFEALGHRTPIVSCQDGGGVVSRFGAHVDNVGGDGRELLEPLAAALGRLLGDRAERERLGCAGQAWVAETHSRATFLAKLGELAAASGLAWRPPPSTGPAVPRALEAPASR